MVTMKSQQSLTKILFILLLSSAVIPSGVQAGFSIADGKKFAEVTLVVTIAIGIAAMEAKGIEAKVAFPIMAGSGAVGAAVVEIISGTGLVGTIGAGTGGGMGVMLGLLGGTGTYTIMEKKMTTMGRIIIGGGGVAGGTIGAVGTKKLAEKLFQSKNCSR